SAFIFRQEILPDPGRVDPAPAGRDRSNSLLSLHGHAFIADVAVPEEVTVAVAIAQLLLQRFIDFDAAPPAHLSVEMRVRGHRQLFVERLDLNLSLENLEAG